MRSGFLIFLAGAAFAQSFVVQPSGSTASLRGVWAVNEKTAWASGTRGTYLKTIDGGATWTAATVPGAETLDFRDVQGVDENIAYVLSIGTGETSRVYKTVDGGAHWTLLLQNPDAKGFFDEMAFWDATHGILVGDQVDGQLVVMSTEDGGKTWQRQKMPPALPGEGAFAASGTGITVLGPSEVWIGTGGKDAARVYHSKDGGRTWTVAATPIRADSAAAGIFSLAFSDAMHGVAVGGDYNKANDETGNIAITADGGATWTKPDGAVIIIVDSMLGSVFTLGGAGQQKVRTQSRYCENTAVAVLSYTGSTIYANAEGDSVRNPDSSRASGDRRG